MDSWLKDTRASVGTATVFCLSSFGVNMEVF